MPRDELQRASEELRQASEAASGDLRERLYDQSDQLARLATRDRGPDHGRLARHLNAFEEMKAEADETVTAHLESAAAAVTEYRKTVEGV